MTQMNKFEDLNDRFASLGTGMTQQRKFRDRGCTLLIEFGYIFPVTYSDVARFHMHSCISFLQAASLY
jgi:hypothetical protein